MKKLIAGTMVAVALLTMATGCSSNNGKWYYYQGVEVKRNNETNSYQSYDYLNRIKIEDGYLITQKQSYDCEMETTANKFLKKNNCYYFTTNSVGTEYNENHYFIISGKTIHIITIYDESTSEDEIYKVK